MPDPVQLQSIIFGEDRIEISFTEARHVTRTGVRIQTLQYSTVGMDQEMKDLVDAALAVLDAVEVAERNPPQRIPLHD